MKIHNISSVYIHLYRNALRHYKYIIHNCFEFRLACVVWYYYDVQAKQRQTATRTTSRKCERETEPDQKFKQQNKK